MSNITDILFSAQGGQLVDNLAQRFGLSNEQIEAAIKALIPALSLGMQNAANQADSLEKLVVAVAHPAHVAAFDNPEAHTDESAAQGRELIASLFGSSAAAGQVAQLAARESGVRPDILAQLLPLLAPIVLGGLSKALSGQGLGGILGQLASSGALGSVLGQLTGAAPGGAGGSAAAPGGGGLLGGLLGALLGGSGGGGLLGSILGGGRAPAPGPAAPQRSPQGSALPGGFDPATLQAALEQIKKSLQPGAATASASHDADLQDVLGKVFGPAAR